MKSSIWANPPRSTLERTREWERGHINTLSIEIERFVGTN